MHARSGAHFAVEGNSRIKPAFCAKDDVPGAIARRAFYNPLARRALHVRTEHHTLGSGPLRYLPYVGIRTGGEHLGSAVNAWSISSASRLPLLPQSKWAHYRPDVPS